MEQIPENSAEFSLENWISDHQSQWSLIIKNLNLKMKDLTGVNEILGEIYTQRQLCCEQYYVMLNKISALSKDYKKQYATRYNYYKIKADIRYSSDSAINSQINSDLADYIYNTNLLDNYAKFLESTVKTFDNMIYGVNNRIKIEELLTSFK